MKVIILSLFISFFTTCCFAQKDNTFLLRGHIKNCDQNSFVYGTTAFFTSSVGSIMVGKKGNFSKKIYLDGVQDVSVQLKNEGVMFSAYPGDIINLTYDQNNIYNTLQMNSPSVKRTKELNLAVIISKERFKPFTELSQKLATSTELADSVKFKLINESYNKEMALISTTLGIPNNSPKAFYDNYFKHATLLASSNLIKNFTLNLKQMINI